MKPSPSFDTSSLEVRVSWASLHRWKAGGQYNQPMGSYALWLIEDGAVEVSDSQKSWTVSAGDMLLWPSVVPRHLKTLCNAQWLSVGLSVWALGHLDVLHWLGPPRTWRPSPEDFSSLQNWMSQIITETKVPRADNHNEFFTHVSMDLMYEYSQQLRHVKFASTTQLLREGLAQAIVARCWNQLSETDVSTVLAAHAPSWIQNSLIQMRETPQISIEELAHHAGFSPAQFRRRFQSSTGSTPRDYLGRIRLEKARALLETTDLPVRAIAAQCGFQSVPHFIHMFESKTGWSPARYRNSVLRSIV